jgi:hypothetical protein
VAIDRQGSRSTAAATVSERLHGRRSAVLAARPRLAPCPGDRRLRADDSRLGLVRSTADTVRERALARGAVRVK